MTSREIINNTTRSAHCALLAIALGVGGCDGPQGGQGEQGEQGEIGPQGPAGRDIAVDPSLSPVEKMFVAVGGRAAIEGLSSFRLDVRGDRNFIGETYSPGERLEPLNNYEGTLTYDVANDFSRADLQRTLTAFGVTRTPQSYAEIVRGELGVVDGADGLFGMPGGDLLPAGTAAIRKQHRLMNPQLILKEIARDSSLASDAGSAVLDGSLHELVVVADPVHPITLWVNAATGRISKLTTLEVDHLFRDVPLEVFYEGWTKDAGGPSFPEKVVMAVDGQVILSETRTAIAVNVALDPARFEFPAGAAPIADAAEALRGARDQHFHQNFAGLGLRLDGPQTAVQAMELAPGVFFLGGALHNSMAIEQSNGIVIVEAPVYNDRSRALLDWASHQFPNKPVTHVISTHFHDDHSGGLREFVAEGITIVSEASSEAFYRRAFDAPSTIVPDKLALQPKAPHFLPVPEGGSLTLSDALRPIEVRTLDNIHAADMVVAYLPNENVLFESDLFSPGFPPIVDQWSLDLRTALNAWGLTNVMIAGGHGGMGTFADLP